MTCPSACSSRAAGCTPSLNGSSILSTRQTYGDLGWLFARSVIRARPRSALLEGSRDGPPRERPHGSWLSAGYHGIGGVGSSTGVGAAHYRTTSHLPIYTPVTCLDAADRIRPGIARHIGRIAAVEAVDLTYSAVLDLRETNPTGELGYRACDRPCATGPGLFHRPDRGHHLTRPVHRTRPADLPCRQLTRPRTAALAADRAAARRRRNCDWPGPACAAQTRSPGDPTALLRPYPSSAMVVLTWHNPNPAAWSRPRRLRSKGRMAAIWQALVLIRPTYCYRDDDVYVDNMLSPYATLYETPPRSPWPPGVVAG